MASSFWRVIGIAENVPLYAMLALGAGLTGYTFSRAISTGSDVVCSTTRRNLCDENIAYTPKIRDEAKWAEGGLFRGLSKVHGHPTVFPSIGSSRMA